MNEKYIETLLSDLDREINSYQGLLAIVDNPNSNVESETKDLDIVVMKAKINAFKAARDLIKKASLDLGGNNEIIMTSQEKKIFYRIVKIILWFRRLLKIN